MLTSLQKSEKMYSSQAVSLVMWNINNNFDFSMPYGTHGRSSRMQLLG